MKKLRDTEITNPRLDSHQGMEIEFKPRQYDGSRFSATEILNT